MTIQNFSSEDDLESEGRSPDIKMRTPSDYPNNSIQNKGVALEKGGSKGEPSPSKRLSAKKDRLNDLKQKEDNLDRLGITRAKYMKNIADGLEAKEWMFCCDRQGSMVEVLVPSWEKTVKWATEMAAKLHGDMIERREISHEVGEETVSRLRQLTVEQLKARASALVLGKPVEPLGAVEASVEVVE